MTKSLDPKTVELSRNEQTFHTYSAEVLDIKKQRSCKTYNSLVVNKVAITVPFPSGSTLEGNSNVRVTSDAVHVTHGRPVQDVFFVVNMYNAKTDQQKNVDMIELKDYAEMTSGSKKNGTRDNRKWIRFGGYQLFDHDTAIPFEEQVAKVYPITSIPTEAERAFAVRFKHDIINVGNLSETMENSLGSNFHALIGHHTGQILEKQLRGNGHSPLIILGNRVYCEEGSSKYGLREMNGYQGSTVYDGKGKAKLLQEPCTAHFFQHITVSKFIEEFFGSTVGINADEETLKRMSTVLRGTRIIVATAKHEPNRVCQIFGVGSCNDKEAVWNPIDGELSSALKSPNLPLINIGDKGKPFYYPAELCKVHEDKQLFHGQLPTTISEEHFKKTSDESSLPSHKPLNGDPYPKAQSADFTVVVINMVTEVDGRSTTAVNNDVLESFKEHIGKRYNNSLEHALSGLKTLELTYQSISDDLARHLKPGVKSAVIIITPHGLPARKVDEVRSICDTRLGVQCHIIPGRDVTRRFHPVHDVGMKKITGGIVQGIFARANIIKGGQDQSAVELSEIPSQLFGIHISKLDPAGTYLVDIIGVSGPDHQNVRVTNHVFLATTSESLAAHLASFIENDLHVSTKSLSIYIRGLGEYENEELMNFLIVEIQLCFSMKSADNSFTLTSIISGPKILMAKKNETILLPADSSSVVEPLTSEQIANHEQQTDGIMSQIYNVLPHYHTVSSSHSPHRVEYLRSAVLESDKHTLIPSTNQTRSYGTVLSTCKIPSILYLAGEASKRSQLRIHKKDPAKLKIEKDQAKGGKTALPVCELEVKPVHAQLKNTFYFL